MDTSQETTGAVKIKAARRLRSNDEKRRIVEEARAPGVSVAEVARRHGVNANLLFNWKRLYDLGLLERCREPVRLLPVTIAPDDGEVSRPLGLIDGVIEVEVGSHGRVCIRGHVDLDAVTAAIRALRR